MNTVNTQNLPHSEINQPTDVAHNNEATKPSLNPSDITTTTGKITKLLFNAHSDVDGFLLDNAHQVHLHPNAATDLMKSAKVGETVTIKGIKSKTVDLLFAYSITYENGTVLNIVHEPKKKWLEKVIYIEYLYKFKSINCISIIL